MSIAASWLILAIIVLCLLPQKAPKAMRCVLWALVSVWLAFPFSLEQTLFDDDMISKVNKNDIPRG